MESNDLLCKVKSVCSEFLGGVWQTQSDEILIEKFKVGAVNRTFCCSIQINGTTEKVVVKLYGTGNFNVGEFKCHCEAAEAVIFDRLASSQLAPKLLGIFNGGRIEEFIHGRNVTLDDLKDIEMYKAVARKLAHFHSKQMPITKQKVFTPIVAELILIEATEALHLSVDQRNIMSKLEEFPLRDEFEWGLRLAANCESKIVFSHNDLYLVNTMLKDVGESLFDRFLIIDYETSDYDYRGIDLSQFLYSTEFDMVAGGNESSMEYIGKIVTDTLLETVAEEYLKELKSIGEVTDDAVDNVDHLVMEIEVLGLRVYLIFLIFIRVIVYTSNCNVNSLEYVNDLIEQYNSLKNLVIRKYPQLI